MRTNKLLLADGSEAEAAWTGQEAFAGALALMTEHARASGERQAAIAQTVSAYLMQVATLACTSAECRKALLVLAAHWASLAHSRDFSREDGALWHATPAAVQ